LGFLYTRQGNIAKAEPLQIEALALREKLLGPMHLAFADGLEDATYMYLIKGDRGEALKRITQSLAITRYHLDVAAKIQSERQQLLMATSFRQRLDLFLKLTADEAANESYEPVLAWKGAVFRRQHCMRLARDNPELKENFEALSVIARRLASLVLSPPSERNRDAWDKELCDLMAEKEGIEQVLAPSRAMRAEIKEAAFPTAVRPEQICRCLEQSNRSRFGVSGLFFGYAAAA